METPTIVSQNFETLHSFCENCRGNTPCDMVFTEWNRRTQQSTCTVGFEYSATPKMLCLSVKTGSRFLPQELQILISAEQGAQTRFTARRVTVGLVRNLIILVWGYEIIIMMSTVFLHVTAIKNKLQLIPSRTSCWWELYKFLIHSCMCINLISHVPQKEQTAWCAHVCACHHNCWAKVIARHDHKLKGRGGECKFAWSINHEVQHIEGRTSDYQPERT